MSVCVNELYPSIKVKRLTPKNISSSDHSLFESEYFKKINQVSSYHFKDCFLSNGVIVQKFSFKVWDKFTNVLPIGKKAKFYSWIQVFYKRPINIPKAFILTNNWSNGYFHWMLDVLPKWIALKSRLSGHVLLLESTLFNLGFVKSSLELLKIPYLITNQKDVYHLSECIITDDIAPTGNYNPLIINKLSSELRFLVGINTTAVPFRKIFISRAKAIKRRILNENDLLPILKKYSFEVLYFEELNLNQQILISSQAAVLVSLHGAGLTNILFLCPGSKVFEIRNGRDTNNNCYFSLANAMEVDYYYQIAEGNSLNTHSVDVKVDLAIFEQTLIQLIN